MLLALGAVTAFMDAFPAGSPTYRGPRPELFARCHLPLRTVRDLGASIVSAEGPGQYTFNAVPERPPTWLDRRDDDLLEVHAALPMRYYLEVEQCLGRELPRASAPLPTFTGTGALDPWHVVFVAATSMPDRKDFGPDGFEEVAQYLADARPGPWRFTLLTGNDASSTRAPTGLELVAGLDAADCLDVFATAGLVIGNDTGLTHLAALTERADGTSPQVIGLYGRHPHTKWTTGRSNHHGVATPFSQMLAQADRCPVRDQLDDTVWGNASDLRQVPPATVARFALQKLAGR
ncbi:glycosyltransferase family 9 protein [Promicromonospora sukumoe]|uniref:glycosyltransferase family 9 protein n=1 Tax=Promicromonospora sukumoe TaxID=88382 RepID=UPI00037E8C07|nr:glycosyltransferase family 9 protein [Promicromonospora sukumoe]